MPNDETFLSSGGGSKKNNELVSIRIVMEGRVQKVGLRNWIKNHAVRQSINGWVRNKGDETVEALLYGEEGAVNDFIKSCYQGPSFAHVTRLKEFPQKDIDNPPKEFVILPSS